MTIYIKGRDWGALPNERVNQRLMVSACESLVNLLWTSHRPLRNLWQTPREHLSWISHMYITCGSPINLMQTSHGPLVNLASLSWTYCKPCEPLTNFSWNCHGPHTNFLQLSQGLLMNLFKSLTNLMNLTLTSWESHKPFMNLSWTSHRPLVSLLWTSHKSQWPLWNHNRLLTEPWWNLNNHHRTLVKLQ